MNLISKFHAVLSDPVLLSAYVRWVSHKIVSGKPPRLQLPTAAGNVSIGEWLSFSEYWSFRDLVPDPERLFAQRCLSAPAGGVAIDIGANVGIFTLLLASMGKPVHAFEPIPETFCRLKNNVRYNGLLNIAHLNCLAVGKEPGLVTFSIREDAPATNRMVSQEGTHVGNIASTQVVAVVNLDSYCDKQHIERIDFLKIDVEGMEPHVIRGASNLLKQKKISAALIEICPVNLHSVGFSCADLCNEIDAVPYSLYALNDDGTPGAKLLLHEIEKTSLINAALLPNA